MSEKKLPAPTAEVMNKRMQLRAKMHEIEETFKDQEMDEATEEKYYALGNEDNDLNFKYDFFNKTFEVDGKVGLVDALGNILIPAIYKEILEAYHYDMKDHFVGAVNDDGKFALVKPDGKGTAVTPFMYEYLASDPYSPYYTVKLDDKWGFIDEKGEVIVPCELDGFYPQSNGIIVVEADGKFGIFTTWGVYVKPVFEEVDDSTDFVRVHLGDKWGMLDEHGEFFDEDDEDKMDGHAFLSFLP